MSSSKLLEPCISRRLKFVSKLNENSLSETTSSDYLLDYIDIGNVNSHGEINETTTYKFSDAPSRARRIVKDGDVIISTVRTYLQAIASIEQPPDNLVVSTGFAVITPNIDRFHPRFCKYALRESRFLWEVESRSTGVSYPAINSSSLGDIHISFPSFLAQKVIAQYLDQETARIDALVSEKEQMLALLEEKRTALISRAVTRGLNPNVTFKSSGLDWLGEVPEHWDVCQLKRLWASSDYGISDSIREEGTIPVLRMSCIDNGKIDIAKSGAINEVDEQLLLKKNDLLFNRTNSLDQIAKVGMIDFDVDFSLTFASYLVRIRTTKHTNPEYLVYLLNSLEFLEFARKNAIPAIGQANLSPSKYGDLKVTVPDKYEQDEIVEFLNSSFEKFLGLKQELKKSIQLLKERRSALITAAVTGQLSMEEMQHEA